jgi:3-hydroxyisobutyrate dehydrogenase-like beta-hydroxyacid dehydrogenase
MCKNLVEKGGLDKPLILYNRTKQRADDLSARLGTDKTKVVASISDAVKDADIILMCLGDDAAVNGAVDAILEENVQGKLIVDCSTVHPDTTDALETRITAKGAEFVGMPGVFHCLLLRHTPAHLLIIAVFGAPAMAESGNLICVPAGRKESVEKIKPYTSGVISRADVDFADQPAKNSTLLKVIGNTFILQMVEALSEGHVLAEKTGLGTENLHRWIETLFPGPYAAYSSRMLAGDYYQRDEPLFHVDLARKDAGHALALAKKTGASLPAVAVADAHLVKVKQHLGNKGDLPSIYGAVRQESGLRFENME